MKKQQLFLSVMMAIVMMTMSSAKALAFKKESIDIDVDGKSRNMVVFTPDKMKKKMPLFIITHGMNQNPEYQYENDKIYEMIDTAKFVVAYLRSDGNTWDVGGDKDLNFVEKTMDEMYSRYKIDKRRIYWSGFSMGSMLIYRGLERFADKVACFAPTSGFLFHYEPWAHLTKKVNIIHHQSTHDSVFPLDRFDLYDYVGKVAKKNGEGTTQTYTKTEGYQSREGDYVGTKEVWTNADGHVIELFTYPQGDHFPSWHNRQEIWNFVKQFSLPK